MSAPEVVVYSSASCMYCMRAKELLKRKGVDVQEIRVDQNPEQLEAMLERSGGRKTVPQIFIGERHVGGFDDLAELNVGGELDALLAGT